MRVKSLLFYVDRGLWRQIVSVGRIRLTGLFEMVDGTWKQNDLVLYNLEDFLGCNQNMQPTLDKQSLQAVQNRLKQDCKFRRDCFQLKLRSPTEQECETTFEEFLWPLNARKRDEVFNSLVWQKNLEKSQYATAKPYYWLHESFLESLVQFALSNHPVYTKISCVLEQLSWKEKILKFRWMNNFDGHGLVRATVVHNVVENSEPEKNLANSKNSEPEKNLANPKRRKVEKDLDEAKGEGFK